jgi:hypothetical protein
LAGTTKDIPAARFASGFCIDIVPRKTEGAGNAGRWPHPQALWAEKESAHKSVQVGRNIRHSLRNGFTAAPRSSWCAGLVSHHRLRDVSDRRADIAIPQT